MKPTMLLNCVIFAGAGLLLAVGCGGTTTSNTVDSSLSSGSTGDVVASPTPSQDGFWVKVSAGANPVTTYLHPFGAANFSKSCIIATGTSTPTDLQCILNIEEEDLAAQGVNWQINVPAAMCSYLGEQPYYYYNYQPGTCPSSMVVTLDPATSEVASCTVTDAAGVTAAGTVPAGGGSCVFPHAEGSITAAGVVTCVYNYSVAPLTGPNCASGSYTATINNPGQAGPPVVSPATTTVSGSYGGKQSNCLAGPGMMSAWAKDATTGVPIQINHTVTSGYGEVYQLPSTMSVNLGSSDVFTANFYDWAHYSVGAAISTKPPSLSITTDLSGAALVTSVNPAYTYLCYDQTGEVLHRIRLYVNKWDTVAAFKKYASTLGASGSPRSFHQTGGTQDDVEGTDCDVGTSIGIGHCTDFKGWDDFKDMTTGKGSNVFPKETNTAN